MSSLLNILLEWVRQKKNLSKQLKIIKMNAFKRHSQLVGSHLWFLDLKVKNLNRLKTKVSLSQRFKKNPISEDLTFSHQVPSPERIHTTKKSLSLMKQLKTYSEIQKSKKFTSLDLIKQMKDKCTYFRSILTTYFDLNKKISAIKNRSKTKNFKACRND